MNDLVLLLIPITSAIFIGGMLWQRNFEKKTWNNGTCVCGEEWESFGVDSQGGTGYSCKNSHIIWMSWI